MHRKYIVVAVALLLAAGCTTIYKPPSDGPISTISFAFTNPVQNHVNRFRGEKCSGVELVEVNIGRDAPRTTTFRMHEPVTLQLISMISRQDVVTGRVSRTVSCNNTFTLLPTAEEYLFQLVTEGEACSLLAYKADENGNRVTATDDIVSTESCPSRLPY